MPGAPSSVLVPYVKTKMGIFDGMSTAQHRGLRLPGRCRMILPSQRTRPGKPSEFCKHAKKGRYRDNIVI